VASTLLARAEGSWLTSDLRNEGRAPIPDQVAEKLAGQRFSDFGKLCEAVWKLVAQTPELAREFTDHNFRLMRNGNAPYLPQSEQVIVSRTGKLSQWPWELHYDPAIGRGGVVHDLSAIRIVTPRQHDMLGKQEEMQ